MDNSQKNQANSNQSASSASPVSSDTLMPGHGGSNSPTSSQSLASSETSMSQGGVGTTGQDKQANKAVKPTALKVASTSKSTPKASAAKSDMGKAGTASRKATASSSNRSVTGRQDQEATNYGDNFGNSMEAGYQDRDRAENRNSGASRGEFGAHGAGNTQGGYGNQYRTPDHNQDDNRGGYYGSQEPAGGYSTHPNSYRDYDGRGDYHERSGNYNTGQDRWSRDDRSWNMGRSEGPRNSWGGSNQDDAGYGYRDQQDYRQADSRNRNYYNRDNQGYQEPSRNQHYDQRDASGYTNDNGSRPGRDRGYSNDYGHSSTSNPYGNREEQRYGRSQSYDAENYGRSSRNQREDYRPDPRHDGSGNGMRNQGGNPYPSGYYRNDMNRYEGQGGYGNDYSSRRDNFDSRNNQGYNSYQGNSRDGFGSRGGSYNDEYSSGNPNQRGGSPARGDYDRHDQARNYGSERRDQYRNSHEDAPDYGSSPRRNRGRDDE